MPDPAAPPLLEAHGLSKSFRGLRALDDYELRLAQGSIHGVIGPNGAGKTTLFHLLSGFLHPTSGTHRVRGPGRHRTRPRTRSRGSGSAGRSRTSGCSATCRSSTTSRSRVQRHVPRSLLGTARSRAPAFRRARARAGRPRRSTCSSCSASPARRDRAARSLPYGDQRRLEIARAVGAQPKVLLLDEPNAGMNPIETQELLGLIRRLRDELGITIVLVAHDIPLVMNLCDRIQVLNYGQLIAEGDPAAVRVQPRGHRRLPRQGARCLSSPTSTSSTATSARCRACR